MFETFDLAPYASFFFNSSKDMFIHVRTKDELVVLRKRQQWLYDLSVVVSGYGESGIIITHNVAVGMLCLSCSCRITSVMMQLVERK